MLKNTVFKEVILLDMSSFDLPNWVTIIIELGIGIGIAIVLYKLQARTSKLGKLLPKISFMTSRIDSLLEQRRMDEQSKKTFECKIIIDHL